jgi:hypothetical protein
MRGVDEAVTASAAEVRTFTELGVPWAVGAGRSPAPG